MLVQNNDFNFLSNTIRKDGMVSATALTTAYRNTTGVRKDVAKWLDTQSAKDSIAYLERVTQYLVTDLVFVEHGVGTWIHPKLAPILAMWISPEFQFAVVDLIEAVAPGKTLVRFFANLEKPGYVNCRTRVGYFAVFVKGYKNFSTTETAC